MAVAAKVKLLSVVASVLSLGLVSAVKTGFQPQDISKKLVRREGSQMTTQNNGSDRWEVPASEKIQGVLGSDGLLSDGSRYDANHNVTKASSYTKVCDEGDCCRSNGAMLDHFANPGATTPEYCQAACDANVECKYFSHSTLWTNCALCSKCDLTTTGCCAPLYTSWEKAACDQPPSTTGYSFDSAAGTTSIDGFAPTGVTCASGYAGDVTYTVCESAGTEYSVSGCEACSTFTTKGTCSEGCWWDNDGGACKAFSYTKISDAGDCCRSNGAMLSHFANPGATTPEHCQAACDADVECKYFSHSTLWTNCALCSECNPTTTGCCAPLYTSWEKAPTPEPWDENHIEFQGTHEDLNYIDEYGFIERHRPEFGMFKRCVAAFNETGQETSNEGHCTSCLSDGQCGWQRTSRYNNLVLNAGSNELHWEHVGEFWADCADNTPAKWRVETRMVGGDHAAFHNAKTAVYLAEEGGELYGQLQQEKNHPYDWGLVEWHKINEGQATLSTGSTRLRVVIKAINQTEGIKVALNVKIMGAPHSVGNCMDNKMCLKAIGFSGAGSSLREDPAVQLQCLKNEILTCTDELCSEVSQPISICNANLNTECESWKECLNAHPADKAMLKAMTEAGLLQTNSAQLAERKLTPDNEDGEDGEDGEVTGQCANPKTDDPESWECECAKTLHELCGTNATCIKGQYCASDKVCPSWKVQANCPPVSPLFTPNASMQQDVAVRADKMQARRQSLGGTSLFDRATLDQSISSKAACASAR